MMRREKNGFTLIELLTVMAISAVLLTIIVVPVFQTFNFTRSAQAFADAQARASIVADKISREIGGAASMRNLSSLVATTLNGTSTQMPQHSLIVTVPNKGDTAQVEVALAYVKLDIVKPAEGNTSFDPNGVPVYTNPVNGFVDPTMQAPRGQPNLPVAAGPTIVRYFVGLHNPFAVYNNPYDGILMSRGGGRDNLYVLYRIEIQPYVVRQGMGSNGDTTVRYRPNLQFFQSDSATDTTIVDYDDPRFFLNDNAPALGIAQGTKAQRIQAWLSKAVIQTEVSRYDMIQPIYDKFSHEVTYNGGAPLIVPLIQFRPSHMSNDAAQGQVAVRAGEETNNAAAIGPDVYRTQYGLWSNQVARVWPQGWGPVNGFDQYFVARNDPSNGSSGAPPGYSIYYYDPANSSTDYNSGQEVFDMYTYEQVGASGGLYPFSQAVTAANNRSNWLATQTIKNEFVPFDMNTGKGTIYTSFGINEVGDPTQTPPASNPQNLPAALTSPAGYGPYVPGNDPGRVLNGTTNTYSIPGNFYDAAFSSINERFNWVYDNAPNLANITDRFIDLRVTNNADGSISPLNPTGGFAKCRIVPGSEVVYGPDQNPGPNLGNTVRYVRTTHAPGPNQYEINYVDQVEPTDYTLLGLTQAQVAGFNPTTYDPQNFCSAIIQPRFKKGYIKLNSDPNIPLPMGQFQISYRFQFNGTQTSPAPAAGTNASDVFAVDYDTRQLISVVLTIRNYPQTTNIPNPQTVTVKATANVRNVIR